MGITLKGNKQIQRILEQVVENIVEESAPRIGKRAVDYIKGETRSGNQLQDGKKTKFPSLKRSTRNQREYLSQFNRTHSTFSATRSNLTLTGQLVDAVKFEVNGNTITVFVDKSNRTGYKTGSSTLKSITNEALAEFLDDKGFGFLGLDKKGEQIVVREFEAALRRALKKSGLT